MGKRDSFLLADDLSLLLGSQSSLDGGENVALCFHRLLSPKFILHLISFWIHIQQSSCPGSWRAQQHGPVRPC